MFLEERLDEKFSFGSGYGKSYAVEIVSTSNGSEYASLRHPYQMISVSLDFTNKTEAYVLDYIESLFDRSGGKFGGFRWKHPSHFSTNDNTGTPTYNDQACVLVSAGVYQATLWYGTEGGASSTRRRIRKPVAGSMLVGIRDDADNPNQITATGVSPQRWTVDSTTGLITFAANKTDTITGITQAAQAVITVGTHGYVIGDSVHISGVAGMTQINGRRGTVTAIGATTITVAINSSAFSAYTSGGTVNTRPQANETVTCGCEFDIPVRFAADISDIVYRTRNSADVIMATSVQLIERLNP